MIWMQHLVDRMQDGYRDKFIIKDLQKEGVSNVFSEDSKKKRKLQEVGNIELYELSETVRTTQCLICLKHSKQGTIYCGFGKCLILSQQHEDKIRRRIDIPAQPLYAVRRGRQGVRHAPEEWQYIDWKAVDAAQNCKKRRCTSIARRWRDKASYRDTRQ